MKHRRLVRNVAWLGVAGTVVFISTSIAATASPVASCAPVADSGPLSHPLKPKRVPSVLTGGSDGFHLRFDDARHAKTLPVVLQATPPLTPGKDQIRVELGDGYLRGTEDRTISAANEGLTVTGGVTPNGNVQVCLALDPHNVADLAPDRYTGTVLVGGDVQAVSLPVAVTLRASRSYGMLLAFIGVFIGLSVKMFAELAARRRSDKIGAGQALKEYVSQWSFPVSLLLGAFSGWIGFVEIYELNRTFGAGGTDALKLFGTCFGFQMGSIGGIDLARRVTGDVPSMPHGYAAVPA
jgi:hypothetical protein